MTETIRQKKQYLQRAYNLRESIESDLRELEQLRLLATSISAVDYSAEKISHGGKTGSNTENAVLKICNYEEIVNKEIERYVNVLQEIRCTVMNVENPNERLVLKMRYIEFMDWESIAGKMGYSARQIFRLHTDALKNIKISKDGSECQ